MAWYLFWQQDGGEETWRLALADQRERIVRDNQPQFVTALDVDNDFKGEMTSEDLDKVHFRGNLYFDFDASSLDEVIPQFKKFLNKLKDEHQFDLDQASLYASGGKGFHAIVPVQCFLPKPNPKGYAHLPHIYKEVALELYVDTLDLRVYTARRGRQFRVENVIRPNGKYKVPITLAEALSMTPETYTALVSAPRHVAAPAPASLNSSLALLFSSSHDKVEKALKNRKKSKVDAKLLARFGGDVPPTILAIMRGENVASDAGFQKIATQLSITAHTLGKTEEQFLTLCAGLCESHQSDGTRYNTPAKRRAELMRMYRYMSNNPCYDFSIGGIKSLVAPETKTPDLDNGNVEIEEEEEGDESLDWSLTQGVRVTTRGIYKKTEEGLIKICAVGLSEPHQLIDVKTSNVIGYEVTVHLDGHKKGKYVLDMNMFLSRARFMQFTLSVGGSSVSATDPQIGAIADILRARAQKAGKQVYTTGREGLDVIILPSGELDIVWADRYGVLSRNGIAYRLVGERTSEPEFKTDIRNAPPLRGDGGDMTVPEEAREFFRNFFRINAPELLARMFGWYLACFFTQAIRHISEQFPLMQIYGPAGSGKTATNKLLIRLHYYMARPRTQSAVGGTKFAFEALVSASASIPLVIDEFKPREMRKDQVDVLKHLIRTNYDADHISKGRVSSDSGISRMDVRDSRNAAPLIFIGEALESQTAVIARSVEVPLTPESRRGCSAAFSYCHLHRDVLSRFGRHCMESAYQVNLDRLRDELHRNKVLVEQHAGIQGGNADRQVHNMAVILTGLEFGRKVLHRIFGDEFDSEIDRLRDAVLGRRETLVRRNMSEASKVIDTLAYLSRGEEEDKFRMQFGKDYVTNGVFIEIHMRNAYTKYVRFKRSLNEEVLFDNVEAFITGMSNYGALTDRVCIDSVLKDTASTAIFQFNTETLAIDGVGEFKS